MSSDGQRPEAAPDRASGAPEPDGLALPEDALSVPDAPSVPGEPGADPAPLPGAELDLPGDAFDLTGDALDLPGDPLGLPGDAESLSAGLPPPPGEAPAPPSGPPPAAPSPPPSPEPSEPKAAGPGEPAAPVAMRPPSGAFVAPKDAPADVDADAQKSLFESLEAEVAAASADPRMRFGRYILLEELGRSGRGRIVRAWDPTEESEVAVKLIDVARYATSSALERFFDDVSAAMLVRGTGIAAVLDVGDVEGKPYIVRNLVAVEPLRERLDRGITPRDAAGLIRWAATVVDRAHEKDVFHGGIRPENIFVDRAGRTTITDFALVSVLADDPEVGRRTEPIVAPCYLAPEQVDGTATVDARTDVFALAAVLYEMASGRPPFMVDGVASAKAISELVGTLPPAPSTINPELPPTLDRLVLRCLAPDPAERPASMTELSEAIAEQLRDGPLGPQSSARIRIPEISSSGRIRVPGTSSARIQALSASGKLRRPGSESGKVDKPSPSTSSGKIARAAAPEGTSTAASAALSPETVAAVAAVAAATPASKPAAPPHAFSKSGVTPTSEAPEGARRRRSIALVVFLVAVVGVAGWKVGPALLTPAPDPLVVRVTAPADGVVTRGPVVVEGSIESGLLAAITVGPKRYPVPPGERFRVGPVDLPEGSHVIGAVAAEEGVVGASLLGTIHIDRTPPELTVRAPEDGDVGGAATIEVSVDAVDEHLEAVRVGETLLPPGAEGGFIGPVALPDRSGPWKLEVVARDQAGNETNATIVGTLDLEPPRLELRAGEVIASSPTVPVHGRLQDEHPGSVRVDGESVTLLDDGSFVATVTMPEVDGGARSARFEGEDRTGRAAEPVSLRLVRDTAAPKLEIAAPQDGILTRVRDVIVQGTVTDAHRIETVGVGENETTVGEDGAFRVVVTLEEGENAIEVVAVDVAGNAASARRSVFCDTVSPSIELLPEPPREIQGGERDLTVGGRLGEAGCGLTIDGIPVTVSGRSFELSRRLEPGANVIEIVATDPAGNRAVRKIEIAWIAAAPDPEPTAADLEAAAEAARRPPARLNGPEAWWEAAEAQRAAASAKRPAWFENELGMRFVLVPAGTMRIEPQGPGEELREIVAREAFYISVTEVTNAQMRAFQLRHGSPKFKGAGSLDGDLQPAITPRPSIAIDFCAWLSERDGAEGLYRLPDEDEWELAARGGTKDRWFWGDDERAAHRFANLYDPPAKTALGFERPTFPNADGAIGSAPVASYEPNPYGLFDVIGNAAEWCVGRDGAGHHLLRGGSWQSSPAQSDVGLRVDEMPVFFLGFRVVARAVPEGAKTP